MNCRFSLAILMPEAQVKRLVAENGKENAVALMVKKFNVSEELAVARLVSLRMIKKVVAR